MTARGTSHVPQSSLTRFPLILSRVHGSKSAGKFSSSHHSTEAMGEYDLCSPYSSWFQPQRPKFSESVLGSSVWMIDLAPGREQTPDLPVGRPLHPSEILDDPGDPKTHIIFGEEGTVLVIAARSTNPTGSRTSSKSRTSSAMDSTGSKAKKPLPDSGGRLSSNRDNPVRRIRPRQVPVLSRTRHAARPWFQRFGRRHGTCIGCPGLREAADDNPAQKQWQARKVRRGHGQFRETMLKSR